MPYVTREKFNIYDLLPRQRQQKTVAIAEPEEYLAKLYEKYLLGEQYNVCLCPQLYNLQQSLQTFQPDLLLLNPHAFQRFQHAAAAIAALLASYPRLLVVSLGFNTDAEDLKSLMAAGIVSHIDRKLTRPADVVHLIKTLLQ